MKKYRSFTAGVVATLMAVSTVGTALAASSRVEYNKAGISLFGENKVLTGESYKAPNGQDVPSVITYVDETGGKTNYLSIRQISELLDASVGWNAATNSVDIAAPNAGKIGEDVIVGSGKAAERDNVLKPEYGKIVGGIDVTNNGPRTVYSEVRRFVTISSGQHEDFTSVAIPAGETLTRVFRILDNANPLQTTLEFDIDAPVDLSPAENDIVISLLQYDEQD